MNRERKEWPKDGGDYCAGDGAYRISITSEDYAKARAAMNSQIELMELMKVVDMSSRRLALREFPMESAIGNYLRAALVALKEKMMSNCNLCGGPFVAGQTGIGYNPLMGAERHKFCDDRQHERNKAIELLREFVRNCGCHMSNRLCTSCQTFSTFLVSINPELTKENMG